jgi:hypothetical protein
MSDFIVNNSAHNQIRKKAEALSLKRGENGSLPSSDLSKVLTMNSLLSLLVL